MCIGDEVCFKNFKSIKGTIKYIETISNRAIVNINGEQHTVGIEYLEKLE